MATEKRLAPVTVWVALCLVTAAALGQLDHTVVAAPANYFTVTPCRLFDTRTPADGPALSSGAVRIIDVAGRCGVPANATSVFLNLTATQASNFGHLRLSADGTAPPTSVLNFTVGRTRANNAAVRLSNTGRLGTMAVMSGAGTVHLIVDVYGYFVDDVLPVAQDDTSTVAEDAPATTLDVLANDDNSDGGPMLIETVTQPASGTVVIGTGGANLTYQPNANYCNAPPATALDTFDYTLFPGGSTATVSVTVSCVDDAPQLLGAGTVAFTENAGPVMVAPAMLVDDIDDTNLESATVTIAGLRDTGAETLAADTTGTAIVASYVAPTLTLTGSDSLANYQLVLRRVTYDNTDGDPDPAARGVAFVVNDGDLSSSAALATVTVAAANDPPVLVAGGAAPTFTEDGPAVAVDPGLTATDEDDTNLESATVTITNPQDSPANAPGGGSQEILAADTTGTTIVAVYTAPTLTLTGSDTVAHYQQVMRSVTYRNTSQGPNTTARVLAFQAHDGTAASNTVNTTLNVVSVNDPPVLTAGGGSPTFVEDGPAVAVDPGLTVADVDNASLASATVTITNLLNVGAEVLAANTAGTSITASYVAPTLTLSGPDSLANYQQVLRTVSYTNLSPSPSPTPRTVAFQANDGAANSNIVATSVNVTPVNDPPVLTPSGAAAAFTEDGPRVTVDGALTAADPDSPSFASATVTITNLQDAGAEILAATTTGTAITASYTAPTLTLTGADTPANYQQVLRSVTYQNDSDSPSTATARVLAFLANDGLDNSNTANVTVNVVGLNDAPVLTAGGGSPTFTEDGPAVAVDAGLTVTDDDSTDLASATVTITNLLDVGVEVLAANTGGTVIVASYTAPTLTLTGTDTLAHYQQVLRSVTYRNNSQSPNPTPRSVAFRASDGTDLSNIVNTAVSVVSVNDPPVLAGTGTVTFTEDAGAAAVAAALTATDVDSANLTTATVTITNLLDVGFEVLSANVTGTSITASYAAPTLTLSGSDTVAHYQQVLRTVAYINGSQNPNPTTRILNFVASDGLASSNTAVAQVQVVPVNDPPSLTTNPISYATAGHTQLHVAGATRAGVASIADPLSALAKSAPTDPDGPAAPSVVAATGTTGNGGSFNIATDGSFTYVPGLNFTGTDSFSYQVTDSVTPVTGTINVTVSSVIWYVRDLVDGNNPAGGDGRSTDAFETLNAAQMASGANHFIFVFAGNTAVTPLAGGIVLKDGQKLHGEAVGLSVPGFANIIAAGARPRIQNGAGDAVSIPATAGNRQGVEVRGLDLNGTGNGVDVTSSGANLVGVTINNNVISSTGAGAEGIDLNQGSATGAFVAAVTNNTITATGNGLDARRTAAGAIALAFSSNVVTSNANGVAIDGTGTGTTTLTGFADNNVSGATAGTGVLITNAVFDAVPGGAIDTVAGGTLAIGIVGNGVGGAGLFMNTVAGHVNFSDLDVVADNGAAFALTGTGAFNGTIGTQVVVTAGAGSLRATGGPAADVSNATVDLRLGALSSASSPSTGVSLANVSDGTVDARFSAPSSSTITGATGTDFNVSGGNAGISYAGTITNTAGRSVSITSWGGDDATDDLDFSGAISDTALGILVNTNSGSRAISFTGGLTVTPAAGNIGLSATGNTNAGGLRVTGATSTISTTNAVALNVVNTTIGTGGLNFRSLSASGGGSGIVLTNTGTTAGLTVSGTGAAPTGGTIQNMTGDGIALNNTRNISLSSMTITNNQGSGINGDDVTNFSLIGSNVTNNADTATGVEAGIRFQELLGTCAITSTTVSGSSEDNVRITPASGILNNLTITNSTIGPNSAATGGNGVTLFGTGSATATVTVTGTTFTGNRGTGLVSNFQSSGSHTVSISTSIFRDNGKAISLLNNTDTDLTFNVLNNNEIVRSLSNAVELVTSFDSTPSMTAQGTIGNNVVGNNNVDSGSHDLHGIAVDLRGDERTILAVNGNSVRHVDFNGIFLQDADFGSLAGTPSEADLTIRDNSVQDIDDNSGFPCAAPYGTLVDLRHTTQGCLDMASNTSAESPFGCSAAHFRLRQRDTSTFQFERLSDGDGTPGEVLNTVATIQTHAQNENDPGSTANVTLLNGFTEAATGACTKP